MPDLKNQNTLLKATCLFLFTVNALVSLNGCAGNSDFRPVIRSANAQPLYPSTLHARADQSPVEPAPLPHAEPVEIRLFRTFGNDTLVHIMARTIESESTSSPQTGDSRWKNFLRNIQGITVDEIKGVRLRFDLNGRSVYAQSDSEGMIRLNSRDFGSLAPGKYILEAHVAGGQAFAGQSARVPLVVRLSQDNRLGIVSDIDDTIKVSHIADKWEAAKKLMLGNPLTAQAIPGTAAMYRVLESKFDPENQGDVFYVSGSPLNLAPQIYAFLDHQGFPQGAVALKKWGFSEGDDNPLTQNDYKLRELREIMNTYPQKPFLLFGDSGEHDPEIYTALAAEFPGRIKAVFINNVTGEDPASPRFQGIHLTRNTQEATQILKQLNLLSSDEQAQIQNSIH